MSTNAPNTLFELATSFVMHTNRHIFLTGRAGTGKTTFLRHIKEHTNKNTIILAPTGVAAINAGGVTMHSFFQLPIGAFRPVRQRGFSLSPADGTDLETLLRNLRFNKEKRKLIEQLELMIIDEVSMLRADMLDAMDGILRHYRKKYNEPFGGVQVLYIGDLYQLPPVVKDEEWYWLKEFYSSMFFFDALVLKEAKPLCIELDTIYRQTDEKFITVLNNIRNNIASEDDLRMLNKYYDPSFFPDPEEGFIILTSHNAKADRINTSALQKLNSETHSFEGKVEGDFNENALPAERTLTLKAGAQIMFIRNDKGENRRYYNGKIGIINRIKKGEIYVKFPGDDDEMLVEKETWRNIRYKYNEGADKIEEEELGSYKQYPIRLAWAVTIHKSQGLTFEKAIIDAGHSFAPGQVYVALSRLTSLSGLVLASEITPAAIQTDNRITAFTSTALPPSTLQFELQKAQKEFIATLLIKSFEFDSITEAFQENHQEYKTSKLPHQTEAVTWSSDMIRVLSNLRAVSHKFSNQLQYLFHTTVNGNYGQIAERVQAAETYFLKILNEDLIDPSQLHYEKTLVKSKVAKYLKGLKPLVTLLKRKQIQIQQAGKLAQGLAEGRNLTMLLRDYQSGLKETVAAVAAPGSKARKEESRELSLKLLKQGMQIEEIAAERGLVRSTIESHLLSYIVSGEVKVEQLVSKEKEVVIRQAIAEQPEAQASIIKTQLGEDFSFTEIKAVMYQLDREAII